MRANRHCEQLVFNIQGTTVQTVKEYRWVRYMIGSGQPIDGRSQSSSNRVHIFEIHHVIDI